MFNHIYSVLEAVQYGALYLFAAFAAGVTLDTFFPHFDDKTSTAQMLGEVVGQCLALIIVVFYVRVYIHKIPILFPVIGGKHYVPYETTEFDGEMMMGLIFLGCQLNLVKKIDALSSRLYKFIYNEEKTKLGNL